MPKNFRCNACGAEFDTKDELDTHNRTMHPTGTPAGTPGGTKR
ncbi:MAG TPA: hypothetical protein VGQ69_06650 [Gemmatimonadales bacterium]|jgi:hypothetical protein|nr:hypothetical protein [Gemmatimonadales bacterium]HEV8599022.1 hypothetical protein [Gemmatimonadales bacterium]